MILLSAGVVFCNIQLLPQRIFYELYAVTTRVYSEYYIFYYFYHSHGSITIIYLQKKGRKKKSLFLKHCWVLKAYLETLMCKNNSIHKLVFSTRQNRWFLLIEHQEFQRDFKISPLEHSTLLLKISNKHSCSHMLCEPPFPAPNCITAFTWQDFLFTIHYHPFFFLFSTFKLYILIMKDTVHICSNVSYILTIRYMCYIQTNYMVISIH